MNKNANVVTKKSITTQVNGISSKSKKPVTVIDHNKRSHNEKLTSDSAASPLLVGHSAGKITSRDKYAVPELLSILKISKRLEHLTLTENQTIRDFNDMTPRTKNIATEGVFFFSFNNTNIVTKFLIIIDADYYFFVHRL